MMSKIYKSTSLLFILLALISFFYVGLNTNHYAYKLLFVLPLSYFIIFSIYLKNKFKEKATVFFYVYNVVIFFRYVILPFFITYTGYYGGRSPNFPSEASFNMAFFLMVYELFVSSFVIKYFEGRTLNKEKGLNLTLKLGLKHNIVFGLFIVFSLGYLLYDPSWLVLINFFVVNPIEIEVESDLMISAYLLILTKQIVFVFTSFYLASRYMRSKNMIYIYALLIMLALNIGIYLGTNRSDVLVPAITSFLLLNHLLTKKITRKIIFFVAIGLFFMLNQITEARNFASISGESNVMIDRTDFLQAYLGGPYNVALAVETKKDYPEASNLEVMLFDIFRPMIGVNFLIKDLDVSYSNIYFNKRIFLSDKRSQILPMIGQGNLFFGPFFSPLFSVMFIIIAYKFNSLVRKSSDSLIFYFFTLTVARMGFFMGQNTMNMINDLSFNVFLFLILYYANKRMSL